MIGFLIFYSIANFFAFIFGTADATLPDWCNPRSAVPNLAAVLFPGFILGFVIGKLLFTPFKRK